MANPSGSHQEPSHGQSSVNGNGCNGNSAAMKPESSVGMLHNPDVAVEWNAEEQMVLEDGLTKYVSVPNIIRYAKIAMLLSNKTVRDVALRCRWMTKKENSKRRKETRKGIEKKERVTDRSVKPLHFPVQQNVPPFMQLEAPDADNDDVIPFQAIGGPMGELLRQNAQALDQITANIHGFQIQENIDLFCQARNNFRIMNRLNEMPNITMQMPPLPVTINEELANYILPVQW